MIYEVWDTETANQIGQFPTVAEAEALLADVLRVNGPDVAAAMAVIGYPSDGSDPVPVLDGAEFVTRAAMRT